MSKRGALFCAALIMLAAGCTRPPSDALIAADAQNRIGADQRIKAPHIRVTVNRGIVTLSGDVSTTMERAAAAEDAFNASGVGVLVNDLRVAAATVQPLSAPVQMGSRKPSAAIALLPRETVEHSSSTTQSPLPIVSDPPSSNPAAPIGGMNSTGNLPPGGINPAASLPTHPVGSLSASNQALRVSPPPPVVEKINIPPGTVLSVRLLETVGSELNQKGDTFTASLASPVMIGDKVVIPAEAGIHGRVVDAESSGHFTGKPSVVIELDEVAYNGKSYPLSTSQFSKEGTSRNMRTAETIGGAAGVGAILGAIVGGGRGAAIGAAIGAGVGSGVQAKSKANDVEIPSETVLSFRLKSPIEVEPSATLQRSASADPDSPPDPFESDRPVLKHRPGAGSADPAPVDPPVGPPPPSAGPDDPSGEPQAPPNEEGPPVLKRRPN
ncbi:MAG TPA: BON domain-containing protein [Terriglobales bacterium]|jgi:hypothetical protein